MPTLLSFCEKKEPETPEEEAPANEEEAPPAEAPPKDKRPDIEPEFAKERLTKQSLINLVHAYSKSEAAPHYQRLIEEFDHFYEVKSQRARMNDRLGMMEAMNDNNKIKLEKFVDAIKEAETEQSRIQTRLQK
jgi:hypothetical protein